MSISAISSQDTYTRLASGYKINSAADDAAGLAISERLEARTNGYDVGSMNAQDGISVLNIAEGALSGIHDSLQRLRELGVKASNGLYSASDREAIQMEIDGLLQSIQGTAKGTEFNTMKLLDGSMADMDLAANPEGGGLKIQLVNSTLESLGIEDFNVTGQFNLEDIDKAIDKVSESRSKLGAQSNALEHTIRYNDYASYNLTAANSRIKDTDYGEEIIKKNRDEALQQYQIFAIKAKNNEKAGFLKLF